MVRADLARGQVQRLEVGQGVPDPMVETLARYKWQRRCNFVARLGNTGLIVLAKTADDDVAPHFAASPSPIVCNTSKAD